MLSERLFEDILVKYPELIEDRLKFLGRQVTHFGKRIDILFEDRFNEKLIVELKKDNLDRNALSQVMEYEGYILSEKDPCARVMIIANRIPLNLKKAMDHHGIEYKEITYKQLLDFLEKRDEQLFEAVMSNKKDESHTHSDINSNNEIGIKISSYSSKTNNQIIMGTVTNVKAKKDALDRFEIWFSKNSEMDMLYGKTLNPEGIPIKIKLNDKVFPIGFHNTKTCIWLSARVYRDGYNLTDLLKSNGIANRDKLVLTPLGNDTYNITGANEMAAHKLGETQDITILKTGTTLTELSGDDLHQSIIYFRNRIKAELSFTGKRILSFPGGEKGKGDNYELKTKYGLLSIVVVTDETNMNRYMHFITLNQATSQAASDTEINIPKVHDSRVSTLLVENQGHKYICNRGKCTVYKRALKMAVVLEYFKNKFGNVFEIQENGKLIPVIQIADLESLMLFEQIAQFTDQLKTFKQQFRNI
jgi:hypothetical protein